jgi:hypothetical protein
VGAGRDTTGGEVGAGRDAAGAEVGGGAGAEADGAGTEISGGAGAGVGGGEDTRGAEVGGRAGGKTARDGKGATTGADVGCVLTAVCSMAGSGLGDGALRRGFGSDSVDRLGKGSRARLPVLALVGDTFSWSGTVIDDSVC